MIPDTITTYCMRGRGEGRISPMHGVGLVAAVGDGVEQVAHAWVLSALLCRAVVVLHHLVQNVVGDSTAPV